jgi:hypothetical protein
MLVNLRGPARALATLSDALEAAGLSVDFVDGSGFDDADHAPLITVTWHVVAPSRADIACVEAIVEAALANFGRSVLDMGRSFGDSFDARARMTENVSDRPSPMST